jgi:hypothetical protein
MIDDQEQHISGRQDYHMAGEICYYHSRSWEIQIKSRKNFLADCGAIQRVQSQLRLAIGDKETQPIDNHTSDLPKKSK